VGVIVIAVFMALQELGVATEIVTTAFASLFGAVALALALAFGLGNRELAGEVTRRGTSGTGGEAAIAREAATEAAEDEAELAAAPRFFTPRVAARAVPPRAGPRAGVGRRRRPEAAGRGCGGRRRRGAGGRTPRAERGKYLRDIALGAVWRVWRPRPPRLDCSRAPSCAIPTPTAPP
jgi:hypothetical protein